MAWQFVELLGGLQKKAKLRDVLDELNSFSFRRDTIKGDYFWFSKSDLLGMELHYTAKTNQAASDLMVLI